MTFTETFKKYLKSNIFICLLLFSFSVQLASDLSKLYIQKSVYSDYGTLIASLYTFLFSLIVGGFVKAYVLYSMGQDENYISKDQSYFAVFISKVSDWITTEVRYQLRCLLLLLLFIIPGLVESIRLSLSVPMVFWDKDMADESFDPIHSSKDYIQISSPEFIHMLAITFTFLFPVVLLGGAQLIGEKQNIGLASLSVLLTALISLAFYSYILVLFKKYKSSNTGEK